MLTCGNTEFSASHALEHPSKRASHSRVTGVPSHHEPPVKREANKQHKTLTINNLTLPIPPDLLFNVRVFQRNNRIITPRN